MTTKAERLEAIERLRSWLKPGDTVYCILRSVSRSGMSRVIALLKIEEGGRIIDIGPSAAKAGVGSGYDYKKDGIKVGGCGMDMGFALTYDLAYTLWPKGFGCLGEDCPSNDHSNGDRDYTPHAHIGGCQEAVCTCHDPSSWTDPKYCMNGCSQCGCHRVEHWHKEPGYALAHRWL